MVMEKNVQNYTGYVTIRQNDWGYPHSLADMASRIVCDWKFDEDCRKRRLSNCRYSQREDEAL